MTARPTHRPPNPGLDIASLGTVLGIWAHPDDETLLSAGLMAACRDAGQRVVCVTATRGELGTADPAQWPPELLGPIRTRELRAALATVDVAEHHVLGYRDGTCAQQSPAAAVRSLVEVIDQVRPDTIVTFGPDGLTGHQDHQIVSGWSTRARAQAAPKARLLYVTTSAEFTDTWRHLNDSLEVFLADGLPLRTPREQVALQVTLRGADADRKLAALRAHTSQMTDLIAKVGADQFRDWWSVESFILAEHAATSGWGTWQVAA